MTSLALRTFFLRSLAITALGMATAPVANAADVKLYGTANKAMMVYDDGKDTETTIVDNNNESTRIGVAGEQKLDNGLTASALLEMNYNSNASNSITQSTTAGQSATPANTGANLSERIARVGLANDYGAVFLGQQDVAIDDAFSHDLSAATSVMNANIASFGGALTFRNSTGAVVNVGGTNLTPNSFALGNNGNLDATDSIRVNTATFNGFNGSMSASQGGNIDVTARYTHTYGDFAVDSAVGHKFVNDQTATTSNETTGYTMGSLSVKHNSGVAATVAYTTQDLDKKSSGVDNPEGFYSKLGYAWDSFGVAAEYGKFKNPVAVAAEQTMDVYGVGAEYDLGHGVTTGALYRNMSADVAGVANIEDINIFTLAMRVKF